MNWLEDGIDESESKALQSVIYLAVFHHDIAEYLIAMDWYGDGITKEESEAISHMLRIARSDESAALRVIAMPFLNTVEPADEAALLSLRRMAVFRKNEFAMVMAHPSLADGITDDLAPIAAMLYGVAKYNPDLIQTLITPGGVAMEKRSIELPLSGEVELVIVRTRPGAARSMDLLEHAVRTSETLMGEPMPTNYVGLLFEDAVFEGFAGVNSGTHIAILPKYDVDDGSRQADFVPHSIAHEVAHYYWSGNADWIDEGVADFMASAIENTREGNTVGITNDPCAFIANIADLEASDSDRGSDEFHCNYSLGERLFVDMYDTLGDSETWAALRSLYQKSQMEDDSDDNYAGTRLGINHVREAFHPNGSDAATVIARWYDGTEAYDLSRLDTRSANLSLPDINGRIDRAYVTLVKDGPSVSTFSTRDVTDYVLLTLEYSYEVYGFPLETTLEVVVFYEDGFEFKRRQVDIIAESAYIGGTSWRSVGSNPLAPGRYWVYVYDGSRKVAEVQYEVTP